MPNQLSGYFGVGAPSRHTLCRIYTHIEISSECACVQTHGGTQVVEMVHKWCLKWRGAVKRLVLDKNRSLYTLMDYIIYDNMWHLH